MDASLNRDGTDPDIREEEIMKLAIRGMIICLEVLRRGEGIGSGWQLENFIVKRSLEVSETTVA